MTEETRSGLSELIEAEMPRLVRLRRELHAHPQLAYEESHAGELIQRELSEAGIPFAAGLAKTGVVGWLLPPASSPHGAICLRADMDALPIEERTGLPHASRHPGRMHACGHDGHMTILLGAARVLSKLRGELPRPVKLIFQPAEEMECGAEKMLEAGALDERIGGIRSEMVFGLHGWPNLPLGAIGFREGPMMASMHRFRVVVSGKGGHASAPQEAEDPVVAAAQIIVASQSIVSRNVNPLESAVLTVASIHAGEADNVIPSSATLAGTIRALDEGVARRVHRRLADLVELTAKAHGCSAALEMRECCPVTMNHGQAVAFLAEKLGRAFGAGRLISLELPVMGSEDFAFYGQRVPSCYFFLGLRPPDRLDFPKLHTAEFDFNDEALRAGVEAFTRLAL